MLLFQLFIRRVLKKHKRKIQLQSASQIMIHVAQIHQIGDYDTMAFDARIHLVRVAAKIFRKSTLRTIPAPSAGQDICDISAAQHMVAYDLRELFMLGLRRGFFLSVFSFELRNSRKNKKISILQTVLLAFFNFPDSRRT